MSVQHVSDARSDDEWYPLSANQRSLWVLYRMQPALRGRYYCRFATRVTPGIEPASLQAAMNVVARRHAMLRTCFAEIDGQPMQCAQASVTVPVAVFDVDDLDAPALADRVEADSELPFEESTAPLFRAALYRAGSAACVLLLVFDHLVCDAWSMLQLVDELAALLGQRDMQAGAGEGHAVAARAPEFRDYVPEQRAWLQGSSARRQLDHWKSVLSDPYPVPELTYDRRDPEGRNTLAAWLDTDLIESVHALGKQHGASVFVTLMASHFIVLHRLTGQRQLAVGSPMPTRTSDWASSVGTFSNPVVVRADLDPALSVAGLLEQLRPTVWRALKNQAYPLAELVERLAPERGSRGQPYFRTLFGLQKSRTGSDTIAMITRRPDLGPVRWGELQLSAFGRYQSGGGVGMDLLFEVVEVGERIALFLDYHTGRFDRSTAERYLRYWEQVLRSMVADATQAIGSLPMLADVERRQLAQWSAVRAQFPSEQCVHELFEQQALRAADAIAVEYGEQRLSYGELNQRANQLARHLRRLGVAADTRVALVMQRSVEMVVAIIAVLKAGGGYVPLDPAYPAERLSFMLADSAPRVLLVDAASRAVLPPCPADLPIIDVQHTALWAEEPAANLGREAAGLEPHHLAYVIYTSGSTGTPKGVMIEHRNVTRLFAATRAWFEPSPNDAWSLFHSYAFDFSVWEMWGALLHGGRLVVIPYEISRAPQHFYELLCCAGITVLNQTPSAFRQLIEAQQHSPQRHRLRYVIFGGEALDESLLAPWYRQPRNQSAQLINMYGITETTVHVTYRALQAQDAVQRSGSIGVSIPDLGIYILDAHAVPVPIGVPGEIHVTGAGVARGYLNRDELSAQRFLADPFSTEPGARMYRSGDLGRWRTDGSIEYLGRNDAQVKVRGFRIELGEIEAKLRLHPQVTQAVVLTDDDSAGQRLVAYYVGGCGTETLRAHAAASLPQYMVPAGYVQLQALPLTANGKLDRRALIDLRQQATAVAGEYYAPQGEIESILAGLWQQLLHVERVSRSDDFFALGGHSLLAVRMMNSLREQGLQLDVLSIFERPTLAGLAEAVQRAEHVPVPPNLIPQHCKAITPQMLTLIRLSQADIDRIVAAVPGGAANIQDIYPPTPLQAGMLFHHLSAQEDAYVLRTLLRVDTRERLQRLLELLNAAIARHDILRTAVLWEGLVEPVQVVVRQARLSVEEVQLDPAGGCGSEQMRQRFGSYRVDVSRAPMQRTFIARDVPGEGWLLLLVSHHIIEDHSALEELLLELEASLHDREQVLPSAVPFRNFVAGARRTDTAAQENFFRRMLGSIEEPTLPFGLEQVSAGGRHLQRASAVLDAALEQRLRRRARELGVSAATLFHVAWAQVLACTTGREQVVFGTVLVGRTQGGAGVQRAVGMFINTLPIRIDIDDSTAEACVRNAHSTLAELLRYENTPLVQAQGCSGVASWLPLFSALLNYRHSTAAGHGELGWQGIEVLWNEERTNYPLSLMVDDLGQRIEMVALTQAPGAPERVCALMVSALAQLVDALDRAPATSIRGIDVLPQSERHVIEAWNAPAGRAGQHCVHELFEAQVARTPDAVALQEGPRQLSYAQLNRRANQLARYLRSVGVGPEERVALCMERSIDLVVAVLGVLKSGGAYVALEPSYLAVRLQHILEDAAPRLLLTQRALSGVLTSNVAVFEVDADWDVVARLEDSNLPVSELGLTPAHLAYVTYTSGSTGRPKGVMSDHARTINRLVAQVEIAPLAVGEVCAQKTSIGFVDAVFETLHPLLAGAKLVVLANSITADARQLAAAVSTYRVTRWITVPSLASALLQDAQCVQQLQGLRYWLLSGEALSAALLRQLRQQLPQCCFINIYGSSECADATYYVGGSVADESTVPIGRPLVNTRVYILDAQRALVPVGVVGEIHLGGASLAGGYLNLPELTAQRFLTDPFSGEADARMYRTGDLGRWRADGMIEYLGRDDHQVKIRGFRIELGEIEACLRGLAQVSDVVVVARESQAEERRLVAYYVSAAQVGAQALRTHVAAALPSYMVPAAYVRLASLPLTPNGKLDRAALPAPDSGAYGRQGYEAPQGEMETQLAQLWMQLLEVESVGRRDNFFELGGHSLSVMSLTQVLKLQLQVDLSVRDVFEHPKLTQLAERVTEVMLEQFDPEELNALECETAVEAGY